MAEYTIDKIEYGDNVYNLSPNVVYATCPTAASTAAKVATITSGTLNSLNTGDQVIVKFTYANGKASPTLKVGSTDAKSIMRYGTTAPSTSAATSWNAGSCVWFVYDGTYWQMAGWINSTYTVTDKKLEIGAVTSGTTYYPIVGTGTTAATRQYDSTGFEYGVFTGTTETQGGAGIRLGNSTATGTDGNKKGFITIYGTGSNSSTLYGPSSGTSSYNVWLPDKGGIIALTTDIPDVSGKIDTAGTGLSKSGTTLNHSNSVTAQTTQAVYPIKIDAQGHISAYGSAVTIPTIPSNNVTGSGSIDYLARWSGTNTLSSTSLSISTSYNSSSDSYGTIKLYVGSTGQVDWKGQLVFHDGSSSKTITITPPSLTASRTLTLPDKTGTIALTSDLPTVPSNIVNTITTTAGTHTAITSQKGNVSFNVPTKTSHLTNDSGFITSAGVTSITTTAGAHTAITNATGAVSFSIPTTAAHVGAASSSHTHGNITNGGDITATAPTIASGDQIIINDHSASKITNGPTFDGSTTTTALTPKGTWESFAKSDTNTTYTLSGALSSHKFTSTLTAGGSGSGTSTSDFTLAAGTGITITDDTSNRKMTIACSVTNTDTKVSTAAVTSGTLYYPIVGADTTSAATKFYDKTGMTYQATDGVPYNYNTGDAILTLGNSTYLSNNGWKRGVLRLYGRYDYYVNLVASGTLHNCEVNLPEGSGTLALQGELPTISSIHVIEDADLPGTYSADLSNFNNTADTNCLALDLLNSSGGTDLYILTDYYVEPVTVDDYYYEVWWFTGIFKKTGTSHKKITVGIYLDESEVEHGYGEITVTIDAVASAGADGSEGMTIGDWKICWGTISLATTSASGSGTYTAPYYVSSSKISLSYSGIPYVWCQVNGEWTGTRYATPHDISETGFYIRLYASHKNSTATSIRWLSIGKA